MVLYLLQGVRTFVRIRLRKANPMQVIHDVRDYANSTPNSPLGRTDETMMQRITDEAVWAAQRNACVDVCPLYIEHVPKLTD